MAGSLSLSVSNELNELASSQYAPFSHKIAIFSFWGGRRQKSENIFVSARGRRRPQAQTLRTLGCAIARKKNAITNRVRSFPGEMLLPHPRLVHTAAPASRTERRRRGGSKFRKCERGECCEFSSGGRNSCPAARTRPAGVQVKPASSQNATARCVYEANIVLYSPSLSTCAYIPARSLGR